MRLICTTRTSHPFQLREILERDPPPYAILSHRWGNDEITFQDMCNENSNKTHTTGYKKMRRFVERAAQDGYDYAWIDTCCINKESSAELSEAINSMFRWYQLAKRCYAYLNDVPPNDDPEQLNEDMAKSQWFKRGWTLQELIAPSDLVFLANDWTDIASKDMLAPLIQQWTRIDERVLRDSSHLHEYSIASRMSWASERESTRIEDVAYCLMGIFNVNMPLLYGEGERAFIRLQEEIIKESDDQTIFAWRRTKRVDNRFFEPVGLLAQSPADFRYSGKMVQFHYLKESAPFSITNRGVRLALPLCLANPGFGDRLPHEVDDPAEAIFFRWDGLSGYVTLVLQVRDLSMHYARIVGVPLVMTSDGSGQYARVGTSLNMTVGLSQVHQSFDDRALNTVYVAKSFVRGASTLRQRVPGRPQIFRHIDALNPHLYPENAPDRPIIDINKSLILCFDGKFTPESSGMRSNVDKIRQMLDNSGGAQLCYYSKADRGPQSRMIRSYKWLSENYSLGDKIFIFGFCTGAEIAHEFARMIEYVGIPFWEYNDINMLLEIAWSVYQTWNTTLNSDEGDDGSNYWYMVDFRERRCRPADRVKFLGLYDTTDTVLWPGQGGRSMAHMIRHAISMDEKQPTLRPIRMKDRRNPMDIDRKDDQDIQDVFFPGGHADIGGITPFQSTGELSLSHIPLAWMVNEAIQSGLRFDDLKLREEFQLTKQPDKGSFETLELCQLLKLASIQSPIHDKWTLGEESLSSNVGYKIGKWSSASSIHSQYTYPRLGKLSLKSDHPRRINSFDLVNLSVVFRMREHQRDYRPQNFQYHEETWRGLDSALGSLVSFQARGWHFQQRNGDSILSEFGKASNN